MPIVCLLLIWSWVNIPVYSFLVTSKLTHQSINSTMWSLKFICSVLTSLSTLSVISRQCQVVTGSSMLTLIVLPHCLTEVSDPRHFLPDTTSSHIILTPERPVLAKYPSAKRGATSTIVKDFGMSRPGIEPGTSQSQSGGA